MLNLLRQKVDGRRGSAAHLAGIQPSGQLTHTREFLAFWHDDDGTARCTSVTGSTGVTGSACFTHRARATGCACPASRAGVSSRAGVARGTGVSSGTRAAGGPCVASAPSGAGIASSALRPGWPCGQVDASAQCDTEHSRCNGV